MVVMVSVVVVCCCFLLFLIIFVAVLNGTLFNKMTMPSQSRFARVTVKRVTPSGWGEEKVTPLQAVLLQDLLHSSLAQSAGPRGAGWRRSVGVPHRVERFDRRPIEPFELFTSEFGQNSCQNSGKFSHFFRKS